MTTARLVEQRFKEWTRAKSASEARISIYHRIRDIPYAVVPELNGAEVYAKILTLGKGSCTPKHFLLCHMYQRLGMLVLYAVYPFRWDEIEIDYPPKLRRLAQDLPMSYHLACRVEINGRLVLVDATLDPTLKKLGLPVNMEWDGVNNTWLPINPCDEEQLYYPSEAYLMRAQYDENSLAFYNELNTWLEEIRRL